MNCKKCNCEIPNTAKFCPVCGSAIHTGSETAYNIEPDTENLISAMGKSNAAVLSSDSGAFTSKYSASDFGAAAVADTAVHAKKKSGVKIGIIIAAAIAVLMAVGVVFFLTNKAAFLSTVMSKEKYAAMVEGNYIGQALGNADIQAVSDRISSVSSVYSALSAGDSSKLNTSPEINSDFDNTKLATALGSENNMPAPAYRYDVFPASGVDVKAAIDAYNIMLTEVCGTNAVTVTANGNIELTDTAKSLLGNNIADISKIIERFNNSTVTYETASSDDAAGFKSSLESGTVKIDAKTHVDEDGNVYLMFPFASDKGLKFKINTEKSTDVQPTALELDPKEIERLFGEVVRIYVEEYADSRIQMENGSISAAGLDANGKLITAKFDGDKLDKLIEKIGAKIAGDQYFRDKITGFAEEIGAELSAAEYKEKITEMFNTVIEKIDSLTINTVIDRNGGVIAKSYQAVGSGNNAALSFVDGNDQYALEIGSGDNVLSIFNEKETDKDGELSVKLLSDTKTVNAKVEYSNVEKTKFAGTEICTGTYKISAVLPADFSDSLGKSAITAINGASLTVDNYVEEDTLKTEFTFNVPKYGTLKLTAAVSPKNDNTLLRDIPSDVIEIDPNEDHTLDAETEKQLKDYFDNISDKIQNMDPELNEILNDMNKRNYGTFFEREVVISR